MYKLGPRTEIGKDPARGKIAEQLELDPVAGRQPTCITFLEIETKPQVERLRHLRRRRLTYRVLLGA
jgi:hypothetical protein